MQISWQPCVYDNPVFFSVASPQSGTLSRISSGTRPSVQSVSDVCLKRICLLDTSAFSALEVLDHYCAMMMESPVGTTYELRSHSLFPVGPRMTNKADSCGELLTTVITGKASCICGLGCGDGLTCKTFPSAALLYCSDNTKSVAPR